MDDIKQGLFKKIYLLYGEESYLRLQYRNRLRDALVDKDDAMNYFYHEGRDIGFGEIMDLSETVPFFGSRRVIVLENWSPGEEDSERLVRYIPEIPDTTVIILVETTVDKRTRLYKAISKYGHCAEFGEQTEETLRKWILGSLKKNGFGISAGGLDTFLDRVGTGMNNISNELAKLYDYCQANCCDTTADGLIAIDVKDIKAVCTQTPVSRVFDMLDCMSLKRTGDALDMYHELLYMKESPFGILALIIRQFNIMLQIKELREGRLGDGDIASKVGLPPYIVKKYNDKIKNYSIRDMKDALKACGRTDESIKNGSLSPELAVELLIIEESR